MILTEKCVARSRVQRTKMKMYEKLTSKTKKIYEGMPRMDDFPEKKKKERRGQANKTMIFVKNKNS